MTVCRRSRVCATRLPGPYDADVIALMYKLHHSIELHFGQHLSEMKALELHLDYLTAESN